MTILASIRIYFWWSVAANTYSNGYNCLQTTNFLLLSELLLALTMAQLANLNGVSETLPAIPKLPRFQMSKKRPKVIGFLGNKAENSPEQPVQTTRRVALTLASITLIGSTSSNGVSLAENNGLWLDGPLPVPPVYNSKQFTISFSFCFFLCSFPLLQELIYALKEQILPMRKPAHVLF